MRGRELHKGLGSSMMKHLLKFKHMNNLTEIKFHLSMWLITLLGQDINCVWMSSSIGRDDHSEMVILWMFFYNSFKIQIYVTDDSYDGKSSWEDQY